VLVRYTYAGDANLDGIVNALDFNAVATNFGISSSGLWSQGDFNYDGAVNTADFMAMAQNFGEVLASPAPGTVVPEPGMWACILGIAGLYRRRRYLRGTILVSATVRGASATNRR
jgi:hypothetical protein